LKKNGKKILSSSQKYSNEKNTKRIEIMPFKSTNIREQCNYNDQKHPLNNKIEHVIAQVNMDHLNELILI